MEKNKASKVVQMNKVGINIIVFHPFMKKQIACNLQGTPIVTIKSRRGKVDAQFVKESTAYCTLDPFVVTFLCAILSIKAINVMSILLIDSAFLIMSHS